MYANSITTAYAPGESRTLTVQILSLPPLPIGLQGLKYVGDRNSTHRLRTPSSADLQVCAVRFELTLSGIELFYRQSQQRRICLTHYAIVTIAFRP